MSDNYLKEVFPEPQIVKFRRQDTTRNLLIRSKDQPAPKQTTQRHIKVQKVFGNPGWLVLIYQKKRELKKKARRTGGRK